MHPYRAQYRAQPHRTYRTLIAVALAIGLVGCAKSSEGEKGDPGPAGAPGASGAMRIIRANCDATGCTAQCNDDEVLLVAYCGATRIAATFPTERSATCRARTPANSPLIAACAKSVTP
jgi:hypothetical protein